jgi:hypothetical protein
MGPFNWGTPCLLCYVRRMLSGACLNFKGYDVVCIQLRYLLAVSPNNILRPFAVRLYANRAEIRLHPNNVEIHPAGVHPDCSGPLSTGLSGVVLSRQETGDPH